MDSNFNQPVNSCRYGCVATTLVSPSVDTIVGFGATSAAPNFWDRLDTSTGAVTNINPFTYTAYRDQHIFIDWSVRWASTSAGTQPIPAGSPWVRLELAKNGVLWSIQNSIPYPVGFVLGSASMPHNAARSLPMYAGEALQIMVNHNLTIPGIDMQLNAVVIGIMLIRD